MGLLKYPDNIRKFGTSEMQTLHGDWILDSILLIKKKI